MEANCFTILWWFLPYIDMNQPWVYMCPPSWTPLPPSSQSHPSGLSQCTGFECHFMHRTYWSSISHMVIHVSMLLSQIITPLPSPTESKSLFFTSVYLLLSCLWGHHYHLSKIHVYALIYCIGLFLSDLLHCIIGSSFIHLIRTDSNAFFLIAE